MKESKFEKPACTVKNAATPVEGECSNCGEVIELWSDEDETTCIKCKNVISKNAL